METKYEISNERILSSVLDASLQGREVVGIEEFSQLADDDKMQSKLCRCGDYFQVYRRSRHLVATAHPSHRR